jgi:hypothetical protein
MPHDCWYCKFNRYILVIGMGAMAVVLFVASIASAIHGQWSMAGRELLGVFIPLFAAWAGWKLLRAIPVFFDWIWPESPPKQ